MDLFSNPASASAAREELPGCPVLRDREDRLDGLKKLVDHLAHDFNNMLVPLLGYVTLIKEELPAGSTSLNYANKIETSARRTEALIEKLLMAVRPQRQYNPVPGDLGQLVERIARQWQGELPPTARIELALETKPCPLIFDEALWTNVLHQLLSNARFALATGGRLEISLRASTLADVRARELNVPPQVYELVIRDNGFGMPPEVLRRVCEPFFTTRPKGQAMGLGLTLVHSAVQCHGGQLLIESSEDVGTTITLFLPARPPTSPPAQESPSASVDEAIIMNGRPRVLVVDDDPLVLEVVRTCLQSMGIEVTTAEDGAEAFSSFQRNRRELDLIVSDLSMPRMDGFELYQRVRKIDPKIPVIWISGNLEASRDDALAKFGLKRPALIKKPFTLKTFTEAVRAHLNPSTGAQSKKPQASEPYTSSNSSPSRKP